MITMSTGLAGLAAVVSLAGGLYAWRASKIGIDPGWSSEPVNQQLAQMGWMAGMMKAFEETGNFNRPVAILAVAGGIFSGASCVFGFAGW